MNIRKGPTIFLAVVIVILVPVGLYLNRGFFFGNRGPSPRAEQSRQVEKERPNPPRPDPPPEEPKIESNEQLKDYDPIKTLSRSEYGKANPFSPLVQARPKESTQKIEESKTSEDETAEEASPLIEVTAIFGDTAILKVDGVSRPVEAEETVAGLKVLKVADGEVVLLGKEEYTIKLRGEPFRVPTSKAK